MTWSGYFAFNGNEIVNVQRTEQYAAHAGLTWFRPVYENVALGYMLGDGTRYHTPLLDDAPWVDPDRIESLDFYGVYPLDVTGIEDSPRSSTPVDSLGDGGVPGRLRNGMKTLVFSALLIAGTDAAADYGFQWLKQALSDGPCGPSGASNCNGYDLCYLASEPDIEMSDPALDGVMATLDGGYMQSLPGTTDTELDGGTADQQSDIEYEGGTVTRLPGQEVFDGGTSAITGALGSVTSITDKRVSLDGGGMVEHPNYSFDGGTPTLTGGIFDGSAYPFDYVRPSSGVAPEACLAPYFRSLRRVLFNTGPTVVSKRTMSDGGEVWNVSFTAIVGNPWELGQEVPVIEGFLDPDTAIPWVGGVVPEGGSIDLNGYIHTEGDCTVDAQVPIYDPLFPAMIPPPSVPAVPLGNYTPPTNWRRRQFTIPKQYVPSWGEVVPKMQVHARTDDLRNLRLRFYADPYEIGDISDDPCSYCGDIVISYIPQNHTLVLDGAEQVVYVIAPGGAQRRADSLVFKTDGTPFEWPSLTCGFGYVVTVDLPQTQATPVVDLSLFPRAA